MNEIVKILNISHSTFNDWSQKGHSKYELSLLLQGLDTAQVVSILHTQKEKLKYTPKYKESTRFVILDKSWFSVDLFWTTKDKTKLNIKNIITVYMNRANQIDTDTLCRLFGINRVKKVVLRYIKDEKNQYEALRQLEYFEAKLYNKAYDYLDELQMDYLETPMQRVVDYYCSLEGTETISKRIKDANLSIHKELTLKKMINYYQKEFDDTSTQSGSCIDILEIL
jgi:hypothetical protein